MTLKSLDKKDLAILQELDEDVRLSYAQIGRKTKLSKEVVQYRMKRLEEKGVLTGYICSPKIAAEHIAHKLLIKNKSLSSTKKQEFFDYVTSQKVVSWFASTEGNWDFIITSIVRSHQDFARFVQELMNRFGTYFKEKHILQSTSFVTLREKYLYETKVDERIEYNDLLTTPIITDEVNAALVTALSANARATYVELGKQLSLTPEAISARMRKLDLLQGFGPRINHEKLGLDYYHIFIALEDFTQKESFLKHYMHHPSVVFQMGHIGFYDLHLELVLPHGGAEEFLDELTGKFGEVIASYELLRIAKEHFIQVIR